MRKISSILLILVLIFLTACANEPVQKSAQQSNEDRLQVYTSIYPMYDFAKKIGKDKIDLRLMVPPGAEPHDWEPTAKLMAEMEEADVFIYNGANMEMWVDKLVGSLSNKDLIVVEASKDIELIKFHEYEEVHDKDHHHHEHEEECHHHHEHEEGCNHHHDHKEDHHNHDQDHHKQGEEHHHHNHGEYDPHVWLDPIRVIKQAESIKDAFITADEENKEFYETNYQEFADELKELDAKFKEELKDRRTNYIVVSHGAFGYLGERYGFKQISVSGLTPQEEPSAAKMARISELVKKHEIRYIFFETLANPKLSQVIAEETGANTAVLNPLEGLTQEEVDEGKDYISIMEENLSALKKAVQ